MSYPKRILLAMAAFVAVITIAGSLLFWPLNVLFMAFPAINAAILGVLAIGIILGFWQVWALEPAAYWTDQVSRGFAVPDAPRLVAPLARVLAGREREGVTVSMLAMRSLLESVRLRLAQARILPRALIALLVVLGVLGTLWAVMENASMRTVTSSAIFALASAVVLGVMHVLAWTAESRFFAELEDFLSGRAQLPSSLLGGEGTLPVFLEALLKQTAENLSDIQRMMLKGEEERRVTDSALNSLHDRLGDLADQLRSEQKLIITLSKNYSDLQPAIADLATQVAGALAGSEEMRNHLRSVDMQVGRIVEELRAVREQVPQAMRQEIRLLAQSIAAPGVRTRPEPIYPTHPREAVPPRTPVYPPHPQETAMPPKARAPNHEPREPIHPQMREPMPPNMREPKPPQ